MNTNQSSYRQLPFHVVNKKNNDPFLADVEAMIDLSSRCAKRITRFLLCGCEQKTIVVKDKEVALFSPIFKGAKIEDEVLQNIRYIYQCMEACDASQFAANIYQAFFGKRVSFKEEAIYAANYPKIIKYINDWEKGKELIIQSAKGKNKLVSVKSPQSSVLCCHLAKHCAKLLEKKGILPLFKDKEYHRDFAVNVLYHVFSSLKDFTRKNELCVARFNQNEQDKKSCLSKLSDYHEELNAFMALLAENNYALREHFESKWDGFRESLRDNEQIDSSYPSFIFDFLHDHPYLWNGDHDIFSLFIEYILLNNKKYNNYAIQPLCPPVSLVFGNYTLNAKLSSITKSSTGAQYLNCDVELFPDGCNSSIHTIKCHIPRKYRNVTLDECKKNLSNTFTYDFTYTDEIEAKAGNNDERITGRVKSFFVRLRKCKRRHYKTSSYVYLPINVPWGDGVDSDHSKRISQHDRNLFINNIVKNLNEDDLVATFDMGINEFFSFAFGRKSDVGTPLLYGNPKVTIADCEVDKSQITRTESKFVKKIDAVFKQVSRIKAYKVAFSTFDKQDKLKGKIRTKPRG
jgi:hypothetical protein